MQADDEDRFWTHAGDKFTLGTVNGDLTQLTAQYNPKELAFASSATWNKHANSNGGQVRDQGSYKLFQYGESESRTLTVELLFDGYEERVSVAELVAELERLTVPQDPSSHLAWKRRPQLCVAIWGKTQFRCIVQAVATKLTMFGKDGSPLRAVCTVTLKEVDAIGMLQSDDSVEAATAGIDAALARSKRLRFGLE